MDYTKDQTAVLDDENNRLLVSASAGSGKTATMIEKIYRLLKNKNMELNDLLVITYTEAASMEMKIRLKETLKKNASSSKHLRLQIDKIPVCDIGTLHSYCAKMIRKYFYFLDIKPNFAVLDDNDAKFLQMKALEKVFKEYAKKEDRAFNNLSMIFGGGRDFDKFKKSILSYYEFLNSVDNKKDFLENISISCYNQNLQSNNAYNFMIDYYKRHIKFLIIELNKFLHLAKEQKAEFFIGFIGDCKKALEPFNVLNTLEQIEKYIEILVLPKMTRKKLLPEDSYFKEDFSPFWEQLKENIRALKKVISGRSFEEKQKDLDLARKQILKINEVESLFEKNYANLKLTRNSLDFNDLEKKFIELLGIKEIKESLKYKYVFVDEYQDINSIQEKILGLISSEAKMVMVGDIKQSIYSFRNSTPEIFINKAQKYANSTNNSSERVINLNENFRSNPLILEFVNEIFDRCMSENFGGVNYKENGELVGLSPYEKVNDIPVVEVDIINKKKEESEEEATYDGVYSVLNDKNEYTSLIDEARKEGIIIAKKILNYYGKDYYDIKKKEKVKLKFSDFAILSRGNSFLRQIAKVLMEYHIPVSIKVVDNIYKNKDVVVLLSILKLINNFHDDDSLSVVMASIFGGFSFDEMGSIRQTFQDEEFFYNAFKKFNDFVKNDDKLRAKYLSITIKIDKLFKFIEECRERLIYDSIYNLLNFICEKYDYFDYVLSLPDGTNKLKTIKDFIDSFNATEYNYDLQAYLDFVKNYAYEGKFKATFVGASDCVSLGTIHSSKGLEYPVVFVAGCGEGFSLLTYHEELINDKDMGVAINTFDLESKEKIVNIARRAITINKISKEHEEELRLLYVALTRAKNHLCVLGSYNMEKGSQISSLHEAENVNNYMSWILTSLSSLNFKSIGLNLSGVSQKLKSGVVEYNIFSDNDFSVSKQNDKEINLKKPNKEIYEKLLSLLNFKYKKSENLALKNSVSSLLQEHLTDIENVNLTPKTLNIFEGKKENIKSSKLGTYYHAIMENIDFLKPFTREDFYNIINSLYIENEYLEFIDYDKVLNCVDSIKTLCPTGVKKELPFISYIPYCEIFNSANKEKVIVQGVADLVVEAKDKNYLIDYKITRLKNTDQLVDRYRVQLKLYKICIERALNIKFDDVFIYSFYLGKLIRVDI